MTRERGGRGAIKKALERLQAVDEYWLVADRALNDIVSTIFRKPPSLARALKDFLYVQHMHANVGRQSILTMVCAWLEEAMDMVGDDSIPDYKGKLSREKKNGGS
jgi:hypothetical protein